MNNQLPTFLKSTIWILILLTLSSVTGICQNIYDTLRTVRMTAIPSEEPIALTIRWENDSGDNTYELYKKTKQDTSWGQAIFIGKDQDTSYVDANIKEGQLYEYRILKQTADSIGYAYLFAGVNYQPPTGKGDILLLVDSAAFDLIFDNLLIYKQLLISEGWLPCVVSISAHLSVEEVKSIIIKYEETLDSLTTVLLMGNIAVPHSGNINPDGHTNHKGAWPADVYYGDIDGIWTDSIVKNSTSVYPKLHNVPRDGIFDQDYLPSNIELAIGRIDFSELPIFEWNEYELLNRYLEKNIDYRTGQYKVKKRAVIKNVNPWKEGLGQNGIRNFVPLVSADSIVNETYFDAFYDSFLWSYGSSSGSMFNSNGLGSSKTYADNNFQVIFTAFFGSYFGDYDFENNYLRSVLASGKVLSTAWVGAPNWYFHPMGMGFDLGFCTLLTQNNKGHYYTGWFPQSITINLLGDPTLKAYIVQPPSNLRGIVKENRIELNWSPSKDDILGYQVYKKEKGMDRFKMINKVPFLETGFVDYTGERSYRIQYLVKAVKLEITPSGSFINDSSGPIITIKK